MKLLAERDYRGLELLTGGVPLSASEIEEAIREYGRTVVVPPQSANAFLETIEVITAAPNTWFVAIPLWTAEEGRSDLFAEMTIGVRGDDTTIELENIHVL